MHCGQSQLSPFAVARLQAGRSACGRHCLTCCQGHQQSQVAHKPRIETARLLMDTQLLLSPKWWAEHCASLPEVFSVERQQGEIRQKNSFIQFILLRWVSCSSQTQNKCCSPARTRIVPDQLEHALCTAALWSVLQQDYQLSQTSVRRASYYLADKAGATSEARQSCRTNRTLIKRLALLQVLQRPRPASGRQAGQLGTESVQAGFCIGLCSHATCISVALGGGVTL